MLWLVLLLVLLPIHDAARTGDVKTLQEAERASLDERDEGGSTALMVAVRSGQLKAVRCLVERGVRLDEVDAEGRSALILAVQGKQGDMVRLLLAKGASVSLVGGQPPRSALFYAVETGQRALLNGLIDARSALDQPLPQVGTPLHWAADRAAPEILLALLNPPANARTDTVDDQGRTPLHRAALAGNLEAVRILLSFGADPAAKDAAGATALELASSPKVVELLKNPPKARPHRDVQIRM